MHSQINKLKNSSRASLGLTVPGTVIPGKAVLGFGLGRFEKALAGDWGLLKAEPCRLGNPCMLGV